MFVGLKTVFLFSMLCLCSVSAVYGQASLVSRCQDDMLEVNQVVGRNAWARKCGYIKPTSEGTYNDEGFYLVFLVGKFGGNPNIPITEDAPCISGLTKMGACIGGGCYTPKQSLLFGDLFVPIELAYARDESVVSGLIRTATLSNPVFAKQPIQYYTAGDTKETIFRIHADNGHSLEVTEQHPLIEHDGAIVKAKNLRKDHRLLTDSGKVVSIVDIESFFYTGKVWNVQPKSKNKIENILVAEGFLTGSVRFQNEWASEAYRLSLRDELDISVLH